MDVYIIFDGPPGPEAPRFVEVETPGGQSVKVEWTEDKVEHKGYWRLGPFQLPDLGIRRVR